MMHHSVHNKFCSRAFTLFAVVAISDAKAILLVFILCYHLCVYVFKLQRLSRALKGVALQSCCLGSDSCSAASWMPSLASHVTSVASIVHL